MTTIDNEDIHINHDVIRARDTVRLFLMEDKPKRRNRFINSLRDPEGNLPDLHRLGILCKMYDAFDV